MINRFNLLRQVLALAAALAAGFAWAGGGSENVLLLVNSNSLNSKTIANHYIDLRKVPASNVVYVDWRGGIEAAQGIYFSEQILEPAIKAIAERGLSAQIDYLVYSCDFPSRINLTTLLPDHPFAMPTKPEASCTGAAYLWQLVRDKNPALLSPMVNFYVSPNDGGNIKDCQRMDDTKSRGFRARYYWAPDGSRTNDPSKGQSYLLSTMLGVTTGRGNTVDEVVEYLRRSVKADGTRPRGTFYYMRNNNIRSQTRHACYDAAAAQLKQFGISAAVLPGVLPNGARDVLGVMTGMDRLDFRQARMTMLPGSIGDNLTSYGGALEARASQTPLTDFLRNGASGASGTVFEPTAMQAKFALPSLFIHYARGCSLAESYFQSVSGPYMLLVVGDPLCQPFAVAPQVSLEGMQAGQEVKGTVTIQAKATATPPRRVGAVELFVDGRLVARFAAGQSPQLDTTKLADGYHELRIVAINGDAIESRGRTIVPIVVNNHESKLALTASTASLAATDLVKISASQTGATSIVVRQNRREVARIEGAQGEASVLAATLGRGPVVLQAESSGPTPALSEPLRLEIR